MFSTTYEAFYPNVYRLELERILRAFAARVCGAGPFGTHETDGDSALAGLPSSLRRFFVRAALRFEASKTQRGDATDRRYSFSTGGQDLYLVDMVAGSLTESCRRFGRNCISS